MARRRFVQQPDGSLVEVGLDYVGEPRARYISDAWMQGSRSPIDGSDIGSRTKLREHMKTQGVAHMDELMPDILRARTEQEKAAREERLQDVIVAWNKVRDGHQPKVEQDA